MPKEVEEEPPWKVALNALPPEDQFHILTHVGKKYGMTAEQAHKAAGLTGLVVMGSGPPGTPFSSIPEPLLREGAAGPSQSSALRDMWGTYKDNSLRPEPLQ